MALSDFYTSQFRFPHYFQHQPFNLVAHPVGGLTTFIVERDTCLNLLTNAIIIWNAVYIDKVVLHFHQQGHPLTDEHLIHFWPTRHAHINVYGNYHFQLEHIGKQRPFRTLR